MLLSNGGLGRADILNYIGIAKLFLSSFVLKMIPLIEELSSKEVSLKFFQEDGMRVKISFHKKEKKHTCKRDPDAMLNAQLLIDSLKYLFSVSFYRDHIVITIINNSTS